MHDEACHCQRRAEGRGVSDETRRVRRDDGVRRRGVISKHVSISSVRSDDTDNHETDSCEALRASMFAITGVATYDPSHPSRFSRFHHSEKPRSIHAYGIRAQATRTGTASRPPCPQGSSFHPMTPLRWSPTNLSTTVSRWRRWPAGSRGVLRPHGKASNCRDRTRSKWAGVITGIMEERGTNLLAPYPRNVP